MILFGREMAKFFFYKSKVEVGFLENGVDMFITALLQTNHLSIF